MSIVLTRIDDRLIHGQVVVGWVQALGVKRIVLIDDEVSANAWEQELYSLGVPADLRVDFVSVVDAARAIDGWSEDATKTILLVGDVDTMVRLCERTSVVRKVNLGGLHEGDDRSQRLAYVYLTDEEASRLRGLREQGIEVTAQDVPTARTIPIEALK
jgi:PTS system mannose-specific IIB component/fructoselysine and glucoselysine-specific PTS system IIB component